MKALAPLLTLTASDLGIPTLPEAALPDIDPHSRPHAYVPYMDVTNPHIDYWLVQMHTGNLNFFQTGASMKSIPNPANQGDVRKMIVHHLSFDAGTIDPLWSNPWPRIEQMQRFKTHTVVAPDFSTWGVYPVALSLYNIYRTACVARDLHRIGFKVIPIVQLGHPALANIYPSIWPRSARLVVVDAGHVRTNNSDQTEKLFWDDCKNFKRHFPDAIPWIWSARPAVAQRWQAQIGDCVWCPSRVYALAQLKKFQSQLTEAQSA